MSKVYCVAHDMYDSLSIREVSKIYKINNKMNVEISELIYLI